MQAVELRVGVMLAPKQRSPMEAAFTRFTKETGIKVHSVNLPNAEYKSGFFVNFTVIFHLLQDNPIFQNYRKQDERHRTV